MGRTEDPLQFKSQSTAHLTRTRTTQLTFLAAYLGTTASNGQSDHDGGVNSAASRGVGPSTSPCDPPGVASTSPAPRSSENPADSILVMPIA